jgi:hypothetical protein
LGTGLYRRVFAVVFLCVSLTTNVRAQSISSGQVVGTVADGATHKPLANVAVTAASPSGHYSATTDAHGLYTILGILPDTYTVSFSAKGYAAASTAGVTVFAGSVLHVNIELQRSIKTIASIRSRSVGSAFQPGMTTDTYTVTGPQIQMVQGKDFNTDENSLLRSVPSVTIDKSGTVSIRGGFAFEAGYEFEGIDYTTPTPNLQNTLQNIANFSLLNGVGSVELIPGGGDATHGNSGTGLVLLSAKHGTYPATLHLDFESGYPAFAHQFGLEYAWADPKQRFSNYFGYIGVRKNYQYGFPYDAANVLGTRGTNAATLDTEIDPNLVYYSPSSLDSNDLVDNFIFRFGRNGSQRLQLFYQGQWIRQNLDYGGYQNLQYASGGPGIAPFQGTCPVTPPISTPDQPANSAAQNIFCQNVIPLYPGQPAASAYVTQPDRLNSPFTALKAEYDANPGQSALFAVRYYRALSSQSQDLPSQGVLADPYGGTRTGASSDLTVQLGEKHELRFGGKYEFAQPYGDRLDATSYTAFTNPIGVLWPILHPGQPVPVNFLNTAPNYNPFASQGLEQDFLSPGQCAQLLIAANCGYLASYFPGGVRMPLELDVPTASQQIYGVYAQDDVRFNSRYKSELGVRYDGYNFLIPEDPADPPGVNALRHQRQLEPHIGLTYTAGLRDVIRAGFGHTLAVPLPSLVSSNISKSMYTAFAGIPSYDNSTGLPATYCGVTANLPCANYAQQLYWLVRDYRFGSQPVNTALKGSTFTNYDISWAHEFRDGAALKVTPFFRRGYDIVEQVSSIVGMNPNTGAPVFGNAAYSNLGLQKATGVEFVYTKMKPVGWSVQAGATYIRQIGNEPPGGYLSPAALSAGQIYPSPDLSPLQGVIALTYRNKYGYRFTPVLSANAGYPYGAGYYAIVYCNGKPVSVPITDINSGFTWTPNYIDPQNPGTCTAPNIAATRGTQESNLPGGLLSGLHYNLDLTFEYSPPGAIWTVGMQVQNVTDSIYNTPVFNTCWGIPVANGFDYGSAPCTYNLPQYGKALSSLPSNYPYIIYPNQTPMQARVYLQVKL